MGEKDAVPETFDLKKMRVKHVSDDVPDQFDLSKVSVNPIKSDEFAAPKDNKEGLYQMRTSEGALTQVPYSKVMDAYKSGYKISPDDRFRFANDKVAELSGKGQKGKFNPDTDLPEAFVTMGATPKTPWYKPNLNAVKRGALDLLPTAGGIAGGIIGGGAGVESGPGALATGAAGAVAGGGLGEMARQQLEKSAFPYEHRMKPKQALKNVAVQAGIQGANELGGRLLGKAVSPAIKYFGNTAIESEKAGVKLLPSEAAGKAPSYAEKFLKGSVLTSGKMDKFRAAQNEQTKAAVDKIADGISKFKGTPEELGELVQNGIEQHTKQFRMAQNQLYGDIASQVNERTIQVPVTTTKQVPTGVVDQFGKPTFTTATTTTLQKKIVDDVMPSTIPLKQFAAQELKKLDQLEKVLHPNILGQSREMLQTLIDAPNNLTFSAMRAARSDTLAKVRELDQALAGKQAGLAKKMAELFDSSIMDGVKKSGIPGLEEQVRAADAFTANEHRMFEQALVKKIVDTKRPEAIATLIRNKNMGIEETRDLFKVIPPSLHKPVQRQILVDSMRQATNNISKTFNERKFADSIGSIGDDRGEVIFGSNWKNIKELTGIMEKINGPVGMQGGAGAALQNFSILKNLMLAATPFGLAEHGQYGAAAGSIAAEWASLNVLATAMTNPATTAAMLKVARQFISKLPYMATGAVAVDRGQRSAKGEQPKSVLEETKQKADDLQNDFHKSGFSPAPAETTPPPAVVTPPPAESTTPDFDVEPQSSNKITHRFNPETGKIEAA